MSMVKKPKVIAIVGPTASGKTALSIELARAFDGEIISADSRQVYRGLNLGTGKVTKKEMQGIPHHLLDVREPTQVYTGAEFKHDATSAITDIVERGKLPIVVGGSFFYLELLRGTMQPAPVAPNYELRAHLETLPTETLLAQIQKNDPRRAETIDTDNRRRLIRTLEIIDALGSVPEAVITESPYEWLLLGIDISPNTLRLRIAERLRERMNAGLVEEVKSLHEHGLSFERLDSFGLEYRYVAKYLQGELGDAEVIETLTNKIAQYAKRQRTWLRRMRDVQWFQYPVSLNTVRDELERFLST